MLKKENKCVPKKKILSFVQERGCVYKSELIKELAETDNETEHTAIDRKIIELSWRGLLHIVERDGISVVRDTRLLYQ